MAFFTKRYHPAGTPPGTLAKSKLSAHLPLRMQLVEYDAQQLTIHDNSNLAECAASLENETKTWVHIEGHPDEQTLRELGTSFGIHVLALEDIVNTGQRPKLELFDHQLFVIMALPRFVDGRVEVHQVSFILTDKFLVSFCDTDFAPFTPVIKRLQDSGGRLRAQGVDFLFYSLFDIAVDQGFPILEEFGLQLEDLEVQILKEADSATLEQIHALKRELILLRRMLWPQREVINKLLRDEYPQVKPATHVYLRDCYDHTIQIMDLLETYREMTSSMLDIYLSSVSNRTNEVMRVLTVIATIFIPLTFVAGIYGMNFDRQAGPWNMPELAWPYGYVFAWSIMLVVVVIMLLYFRRKKWF
jgi:magnesium transporter